MGRWLTKTEWEEYLSTYFDCDIEHAWNAVMRMCTLFEKTAKHVGEQLGYEYNEEEGRNARGYLEHVKELSKDADGVY